MQVAQQKQWRKYHMVRSDGGRAGSFAILDYVEPVSKTQLKASSNTHEMSGNLYLKAGGCQDTDTFWSLKSKGDKLY